MPREVVNSTYSIPSAPGVARASRQQQFACLHSRDHSRPATSLVSLDRYPRLLTVYPGWALLRLNLPITVCCTSKWAVCIICLHHHGANFDGLTNSRGASFDGYVCGGCKPQLMLGRCTRWTSDAVSYNKCIIACILCVFASQALCQNQGGSLY